MLAKRTTAGLLSLLATLTLIFAQTASAVAAAPGPPPASPTSGATLNMTHDLFFYVRSVPGATGYLYGFKQNGNLVWENYRDEHVLSGTGYDLKSSVLARKFSAGPMDAWIRALVNGNWTDATIVHTTLAHGSDYWDCSNGACTLAVDHERTGNLVQLIAATPKAQLASAMTQWCAGYFAPIAWSCPVFAAEAVLAAYVLQGQLSQNDNGRGVLITFITTDIRRFGIVPQ